MSPVSRRRAARGSVPSAEALERRTLLSLALVMDVNTQTQSSSPEEFTESGGLLFFAADDGPHGIELWKTDGTPQGSALVKDIDPRPKASLSSPITWGNSEQGSSRPTGLTDLNGTLYFYADDGVHGAELWRSDGTDAGTAMVKDINAGPGESNKLYNAGDWSLPAARPYRSRCSAGRSTSLPPTASTGGPCGAATAPSRARSS